jgi:hypothetical protein
MLDQILYAGLSAGLQTGRSDNRNPSKHDDAPNVKGPRPEKTDSEARKSQKCSSLTHFKVAPSYHFQL